MENQGHRSGPRPEQILERILQTWRGISCEPPLHLSIEETGSPPAEDCLSIEESCNEQQYMSANLYPSHTFSEDFDNFSERDTHIQLDFPPCPVSSNIEDSVDLQESSVVPTVQAAEPFKTLRQEDAPTPASPGEVLLGQALLSLTEETEGPPTGTIALSGKEPSGGPTSAQMEKTKKRRKRRKLGNMNRDHLSWKSIHVFFSVVNGLMMWLLNHFSKAGIGLKKTRILVLLFTILHLTCGTELCEHVFNRNATLDPPIILRDHSLSSICNIKRPTYCPDLANCFGNLSICLIRNSYSMKLIFKAKHSGVYHLECGKDGSAQHIHIGVKGFFKNHHITVAIVLILGLGAAVVIPACFWRYHKRSPESSPSEETQLDVGRGADGGGGHIVEMEPHSANEVHDPLIESASTGASGR
ncbi:uncharacterized protein [Ambystoma mexicanum]|uniref:uncharacterized protein isoform X2 n=1 Tax=Ambystoma mexicanum TaxID=8296 RepID=UPI0037E86466